MTTERLKDFIEMQARGAYVRVIVPEDGPVVIRCDPWVRKFLEGHSYFLLGEVVPIVWKPLRLWDVWKLQRRKLLVLIEV